MGRDECLELIKIRPIKFETAWDSKCLNLFEKNLDETKLEKTVGKPRLVWGGCVEVIKIKPGSLSTVWDSYKQPN